MKKEKRGMKGWNSRERQPNYQAQHQGWTAHLSHEGGELILGVCLTGRGGVTRGGNPYQKEKKKDVGKYLSESFLSYIYASQFEN